MYFDYSALNRYIKVIKNWTKKILTNGSDSPQAIYASFLAGFDEYAGDQLIASTYVHKVDQLSTLQQGVHYRDLEKFLALLSHFDRFEDKVTQVLDWYYGQEIDISLKDTLLLVVSRLPEYLKNVMTNLVESGGIIQPGQPSQLDRFGGHQIAQSLKTLTSIAGKYEFGTLTTFIDIEIIKIDNPEDKSLFLTAAAGVYSEMQQHKKALSFLDQAYNLKEDFKILKHVVELYKKIGNYDKVISLLTSFQNIENTEDRLFVLLNLGLAYNMTYKLDESERILTSANSLIGYAEDTIKIKLTQQPTVNQYLACISLKKGDIVLAEKYIQKYLQITTGKTQNNYADVIMDKNLSGSFLYIGVLLGLKNEWALAQQFLNQKLELLEYTHKPEIVVDDFINLFSNLALISLFNSDIKTTQSYGNLLIEIIDRFGIETTKTRVITILIKALVLIKKKNLTRAYTCVDSIFGMLQNSSRENSFLRVFVFCHLANVFGEIQEFEKAEFYYSKSLILTNELLGEQSPLSQTLSEKIDNLRLSDYKILVVI